MKHESRKSPHEKGRSFRYRPKSLICLVGTE